MSERGKTDSELDDQTMLARIVGKTIASTEYGSPGTDEAVIIRFTDGTGIRFRSWDYEGYASGIYVTEPRD